ncbi:MAG TPA: solute carrier family 23 protein [Actinospica sp.]|jgi:xanthine/uracil permease|nr:solute carrier family 23 protein [Actinospica sp.]
MSAAGEGDIEVGINQRVGVVTAVSLGFQHILGLAGLLLFPALVGKSFGLPPHQVAYLYGITFITSGVVVILQAVGLLRLPVVQAPFAGIFAALLVVGHQIGLGAAFGSLIAASLIWTLLSVPLRHWSVVARLSARISNPIVSGVILLIISTQLATIVLPSYFGTPGASSAFPWINLLSAVFALALVVVCMRGRNKIVRRGAVLWGVIGGAAAYTLLAPSHWGSVAHASAFEGLRWMPFGFGVSGVSVVIFFIAWFPAISETIATYDLIADWTGEPLAPRRVAQGVFGELLGSTLGALFGGLPAMAYPANVGILKVTRVASRWVTFTTGLILVVLGGFGYFDTLLVAIPEPVLSGATTVLFGLIFAGGLEVLGRVRWTQDRMVAAGLPVIAGIGLLFTPATTTARLPSWLGLLVGQPLVISVVLALVCVGYLGWRGGGDVTGAAAVSDVATAEGVTEAVTMARSGEY